MELHTSEWGSGETVIALHPLGLESSAFAAFGEAMGQRGFRTVAADLPGFGRTPADGEPLTPAVLARPVIELARSLSSPPVVLGISMGGRVALECAMTEPEAFQSVIAIAPYLPWQNYRWALGLAHYMSPAAAEAIPLEKAWPVLQLITRLGEQNPWLKEDALAQAGMRFVYNASCPATRWAFVSAAREMALEPAFGRGGFWARLGRLKRPVAFVWGERDRIVSLRLAARVARAQPEAFQYVMPCVAHALNGRHHGCLVELLASMVAEGFAEQARLPGRSLGSRDGAEAVTVACWLADARDDVAEAATQRA